MRVYIDSNFLLELIYLQKQHGSCQNILMFCENHGIQFVVPQFCLVETYLNTIRKKKELGDLLLSLEALIGQIEEKVSIDQESWSTLSGHLTESVSKDILGIKSRYITISSQLFNICEAIPLCSDVFQISREYDDIFKNKKDLMVFSSVLYHLRVTDRVDSCFLTIDSHDFDLPDVETALEDLNCKMFHRMENAHNFIEHSHTGK